MASTAARGKDVKWDPDTDEYRRLRSTLTLNEQVGQSIRLAMVRCMDDLYHDTNEEGRKFICQGVRIVSMTVPGAFETLPILTDRCLYSEYVCANQRHDRRRNEQRRSSNTRYAGGCSSSDIRTSTRTIGWRQPSEPSLTKISGLLRRYQKTGG